MFSPLLYQLSYPAALLCRSYVRVEMRVLTMQNSGSRASASPVVANQLEKARSNCPRRSLVSSRAAQGVRLDFFQARIFGFNEILNPADIFGRGAFRRLLGDRATRGISKNISHRSHGARCWPVRTKFVNGIIHDLRFALTHAAAAHRVVKHRGALVPRPFSLVARHIVQNRSKSISPFPRTANDGPKWSGN